MNSTLIIGGLFALGLLALIALIFLARAEGQPRGTATDPTGTGETAQHSASPNVDPATEAPVSQTLPLQQQWFTVTDGQMQELSVEIKSLHRQAQEIEHRLGIVTEIVARLERASQNRATRIEEEELPHTQGMT